MTKTEGPPVAMPTVDRLADLTPAALEAMKAAVAEEHVEQQKSCLLNMILRSVQTRGRDCDWIVFSTNEDPSLLNMPRNLFPEVASMLIRNGFAVHEIVRGPQCSQYALTWGDVDFERDVRPSLGPHIAVSRLKEA